ATFLLCVVDAPDRRSYLPIPALIDVRRRIGRLRQHRGSHCDCKQKKCCSEHAARTAGKRARDRCFTDGQTLHFCPPSFSVPQGLQVERNATCTKKLQKSEHQFNSKADGPFNSAPA